jgi:proton-coupled amino acid transporter
VAALSMRQCLIVLCCHFVFCFVFCFIGIYYTPTHTDSARPSPFDKFDDIRSKSSSILNWPMEMRLLWLFVVAEATSTAFSFVPSSINSVKVQVPVTSMRRPRSNGRSSYAPLNVEPATAETTTETELLCSDERIDANDAVNECRSVPATQSQFSAATNLAKCICGAGSFALPHVFLEEGVLGGTVAITACGALAAYTMQSLAKSKQRASDSEGSPIVSYVELAENTLGRSAANVVFALTLSASIGVCSTYLVFIGQTLESLSNDASSLNYVRQFFPDVSLFTWEAGTALVLLPLSLLRSYGIFAFTSALGVAAVLGGILVTLASGILVEPGGGLQQTFSQIGELRMWPESLAAAFGGSFGTIAYLFCVNFLTFPIMNSMKNPKKDYGGAVSAAVAGVWLVNVVFAILCLGFYGDQTQDLVLGNLNNGPYLSALKILLCVDLLFTFPIVFSSGRQILENAIIGADAAELDSSAPARTAIVATAITACLLLAQIGGFGAVANLVGGVAQGTLAFIMPPTIAVALARRNGEELVGGETGQLLLGAFGVTVVCSVTYFTALGIFQ